MSKFSLISEKIITLVHEGPIRGIILIENERISGIFEYPASTPLTEIKEIYSEWNPTIYENSYICPGLIELSCRPEWDSESTLSKMAVSGGVTLLCVERNHHWDSPISNEKFTDIRYIESIENCQEDKPSDTVAYKTYLYPPLNKIQSFTDELKCKIDLVGKLGFPLFIDPILPHERLLFQASPCRKLTLTERINFDPQSSENHFSCAFPDEISTCELTTNLKSPENLSEAKDEVPTSPASTVATVRKDSKAWGAAYRRQSLNSIYDDLEEKIRQNQEDLSNLSQLEERSYSQSGVTLAEMRNRSNSCNDEIYQRNDESPAESFRERLNSRRPTPVVIKLIKPDREDIQYLPHVAKIPECWEVNGIKQILSAINQPIHFTKLSSAAAINYIRKLNDPNITCDVPVSHIYLNESLIKTSQFKDFPPIRSENNQKLLWELFKLGDVQVAASHHASIPTSLKQMSGGSFLQSISGIQSLGLSLQMLWSRGMEFEAEENYDEVIETIFMALALNPSKLLKVDNERGSIKKGNLADLVIWRPFEKSNVKDYSLVGKYAFGLEELKGKIERVYVRGHEVFCHHNFKCL